MNLGIELIEVRNRFNTLFKKLKDFFLIMLDQYKFEAFPVLECTHKFALNGGRLQMCVAFYNPLDVDTAKNLMVHHGLKLLESIPGSYYRLAFLENRKVKSIIHLTFVNSPYYSKFSLFEKWLHRSYQNLNYWNNELKKMHSDNDTSSSFNKKMNRLVRTILSKL